MATINVKLVHTERQNRTQKHTYKLTERERRSESEVDVTDSCVVDAESPQLVSGDCCMEQRHRCCCAAALTLMRESLFVKKTANKTHNSAPKHNTQ